MTSSQYRQTIVLGQHQEDTNSRRTVEDATQQPRQHTKRVVQKARNVKSICSETPVPAQSNTANRSRLARRYLNAVELTVDARQWRIVDVFHGRFALIRRDEQPG